MDDHRPVEPARISEPDPIRPHAQRDALTLVEPRAFGAYTVVAQLGCGGTGDVLLALSAGSSGFKKVIVLKVLHEMLENDLESLEMFLDDARIAATLHHPNIVQTFEVGEAEGRHYIAMEYAAGMSLDRILLDCRNRGRVLPTRVCARVAAEVLAGLAYAHELEGEGGAPLEIVHRDISPANVLVGWDGTVKIVDFGTSKARMHIDSFESGVVRGRLAYMAPERAEGVEVDHRADVWSVGVVLWEMLTGARLFRSSGRTTVVNGTDAIPQVAEVRPEVSGVLSDIVAMALQRNRAERYPSAALMRRDLESWLAEEGGITRDDVAATLGDYFEGERERQHLLLNESVGGQPLTATRTGSFAVPSVPEGEAAKDAPLAVEPAPARVPVAPFLLAVFALLAVLAIVFAHARSHSGAALPAANDASTGDAR